MLVLSRKVNEQVVIGDNIWLTVVSIRGNQVRIGFEAPPSISIFREELHHQCTPATSSETPPPACLHSTRLRDQNAVSKS